jgi:hypothetical protein
MNGLTSDFINVQKVEQTGTLRGNLLLVDQIQAD